MRGTLGLSGRTQTAFMQGLPEQLVRLGQFNKTHDFGFDAASLKDINKTILKEYLDEASGRVSA